MRLSAIAAAVAAVGFVEVAAAPIRVIMVSSSIQEPPSHVRWGLAAAAQPPSMPRIVQGQRIHPSQRQPCNGRMGRFRQKGAEISNAFRNALGWPTTSHKLSNLPGNPGGIRILPMNPEEVQFLTPDEPHDNEFWKAKNVALLRGGPPPHHKPHHRLHRGGDRPFLARLHFSLMNLGIWEGRVVAFVLGCGLGVLLRMFWVLAIVVYRIVKRRSPEEDEAEYTHIVMFEDVDPIPAPPAYLVDEKVPVEEDIKPADAAPEAK